jgi:hypothetical protein
MLFSSHFQFAGENALRELFAGEIHIVFDAVKHPIDARPRRAVKVIGETPRQDASSLLFGRLTNPSNRKTAL